jgi:thiosulfate/3-mercaptopyruvate sulfurtransferase
MLRWLGHDAVALLDGGVPLWQMEGRPMTKDVPKPRKGAFVPRARRRALCGTAGADRSRRGPHSRRGEPLLAEESHA